jgi:hypothetical protein
VSAPPSPSYTQPSTRIKVLHLPKVSPVEIQVTFYSFDNRCSTSAGDQLFKKAVLLRF